MALLFMESFDGYGGDNAKMNKYFSAPILNNAATRTGPYAMWNNLGRSITPGSTTIITGFAWYCVLNQPAWVGFSGATDTSTFYFQCCVTLDTDGKVRVRRGGDTGTILDTSSAVLVASSWNFIEVKIDVADAGSWTVKVNGAQVLNASGDTSGGSPVVAYVLKCDSTQRFDDVYVLDATGSSLNDLIGDHKVECLTPQTGNGSNVGLTCSTGTDHGALVDELPPNDDSDYTYGSTAGVKDTYNFTDLATTGVVRAVQVSVRAKKTDSATKSLAVVARQGSTDYDGATQAVASTTYSQYQEIWPKRPSDNADWTVSDVNGAQFGMKVVS